MATTRSRITKAEMAATDYALFAAVTLNTPAGLAPAVVFRSRYHDETAEAAASYVVEVQ